MTLFVEILIRAVCLVFALLLCTGLVTVVVTLGMVAFHAVRGK
jgi:hypothetical protein